MMFKTLKPLLLFLAILAAGLSFAQEEPLEITMIIPEIKTISVHLPRRVAISNPEVADISTVSEQEITLTSKGPGKATLVVWDKSGQKTYSIRVASQDLKLVKLRIDKLVSELGYNEVSTKISKEEDKILLLGTVNNEAEKSRLDSVLSALKEQVLDMVEIKEDNPLVLIDVEILEVSKSVLDDLGFDWTSSISDSDTTGVRWTEQGTTVSQDIYKLGALSRIWDRGVISAQLNLIITRGEGKVLSRPKLVCLSGKEATFLVGGEIPIVKVSTSSGGQSVDVEYKKYGISLNISPTIRADNFIQAGLKTEVSEVDWANAVTASGISIPAFSTRNAETELYLKENQTIFLAGLIKSKDSENVGKLPGLGDIPILGALFRSRKFELGETELVISLTPSIINQRSADEGAGTKQAAPKTLSDYTRFVQEKIARAVVYPQMARGDSVRREVLLSLRVLSTGRLFNVSLARSSGNRILDEASINIVKAQAPFPPLPAESNLDEIWIDVPIVFEK